MVKRPVPINLVKNDKNQTINQIVNWLLGIGKVIIIVVELIAIIAFLYRFSLDARIQSVHEKIKQEQAILQQQKNNESTYLNLQERLSLISSVSDQANQNIKIFKDIIGFAPVGMTFTNVTLTETGVRVEANVSSVYPLATFIDSLKKYPKTASISIDKIENKTASAVITVSISVIFKEQGGANANSGN